MLKPERSEAAAQTSVRGFRKTLALKGEFALNVRSTLAELLEEETGLREEHEVRAQCIIAVNPVGGDGGAVAELVSNRTASELNPLGGVNVCCVLAVAV